MSNPDINSSGIDPGNCGIQDWTRCSVAPRTRMRRLPCSITARTYIFVPLSKSAVKKSSARIPCARDLRNSVPQGRPARSRADPGVLDDLPHRRRCHDRLEWKVQFQGRDFMGSFDVRVFAIRRRPGRRVFEVRRRVAGCDKSRSFITRTLADSYHAELVRAARRGQEFSPPSPRCWPRETGRRPQARELRGTMPADERLWPYSSVPEAPDSGPPTIPYPHRASTR
jgi:hypothetical protein